MNNTSNLAFLTVIVLSVFLYNAKEENKEFKKLNEHNLRRMQYVEINLLSARKKISEIKSFNSNINSQGVEGDIANALTDVRAEMEDLRLINNKRQSFFHILN